MNKLLHERLWDDIPMYAACDHVRCLRGWSC